MMIFCVDSEQVASTGKTAIASGLSIAAGGLSVAGGLAVSTGTSFVSGDVGIDSGSLAVTSPGTSASAIDVYASHATFGGNAILGHVAAAEYNGNAMQLLEGNNVLFQVSFELFCSKKLTIAGRTCANFGLSRCRSDPTVW